MNREQFGNCFQFNYNLVLNQKVDAVSNIDIGSLVGDWNRYLRFDDNIPESEVLDEALAVRALQQARPHRRMHSDSGLNDLAREMAEFHVFNLAVSVTPPSPDEVPRALRGSPSPPC